MTASRRTRVGAALALAAIAPCGAASHAQEAAAPASTLAIAAVPLFFGLPSAELDGLPGAREGAQTVSGVGLGATFGREIGTFGDIPLFVELSGTVAAASGRTGGSTALGPGGGFALGAGASAGDAIVLGTRADGAGATAQADVTVTDPGGDAATVSQLTFSPAGPNRTFLFAESRTPGGGLAFANVATDGAGGAATSIGFAGDGDGVLLAGAGDLSSVRIDRSTRQEVDFAEAELRLLAAVPVGRSGWTAVPSIGPAFRHLGRDVDARTDILLPVDPLTDARAAVAFDVSDELSARYAGGSVGLELVGPAPGGLVLSVGANAGLLDMSADLTARGSATVRGIGTTRIDLAPTSDEIDGIAYFGRLFAGLTKRQGPFVLTLGGQLEYLSDVPVAARDGRGSIGAGGAAVPPGGGVRLDTKDALLMRAGVTLSMTF